MRAPPDDLKREAPNGQGGRDSNKISSLGANEHNDFPKKFKPQLWRSLWGSGGERRPDGHQVSTIYGRGGRVDLARATARRCCRSPASYGQAK